MATQSNPSVAQALRNQVVTLRKQMQALGHKDCHSCYVCYDDWSFERKRCYSRQFSELQIKLLVAVSDLATLNHADSEDVSNPPGTNPINTEVSNE